MSIGTGSTRRSSNRLSVGGVMSTRGQLGEVSAIRQAECPLVVPQNHALRMFAAVMAFALVLPAMGAVIDAAFVSSPALLLLGFFFLIGFGVPCYIFLHCALEHYTASETESGQNLLTSIIDEMALRLTSNGAAKDRGLVSQRTEWNWPLEYGEYPRFLCTESKSQNRKEIRR